MCTCVALRQNGFYFGRNMDLYYELDRKVMITQREYPLKLRFENVISEHYSFIGTAISAKKAFERDEIPLYADAMNEFGLCIACLDFPENAVYFELPQTEKHNIAPFELIPWVLGLCKNVYEAERLLCEACIVDADVNESVGSSPLHWFISDAFVSIAVEPREEGLKITHDPFDVLTNCPPFDFHSYNIRKYGMLDCEYHGCSFGKALKLEPFGFGFGGFGLPGDFSSPSRFVRAAFASAMTKKRERAIVEGSEAKAKAQTCLEEAEVAHTFRVLSSVAMPKGCVKLPDGCEEYTVYSTCMSPKSGRYYFLSYYSLSCFYAELNDDNSEGDGFIAAENEKA